ATLEVRVQQRGRAELAGALEDDVAAVRLPVDFAWRAAVAERHLLAVDGEAVGVRLDVVVPASVDGVELQEVRSRLGAALHLVDVHELDAGPAPCRAQRETSHASKAVDADASAHG